VLLLCSATEIGGPRVAIAPARDRECGLTEAVLTVIGMLEARRIQCQ